MALEVLFCWRLTRTDGIPVTKTSPKDLSKRELYTIFGALMLGMFLSALDGTIVSTALPTIVGELQGANHLSWVVVAYLLASTVSTPLWGKLGDLYGRKNLYQASIVFFLVGSILCGIANSMIALIIFRAIQGLGGGGLMVGAQAVIGDIVPPRDRGRYSGLFGATFGASTVLGPLIGGLIVDHFSWRWVFLVNIPLGIIAFLVTGVALPKTLTRVSHVIDYAGALLLTLSASSFILFTSLGGNTFSWSSWQSCGLAGLGLVAGVAFWRVEMRAVEPVLAPRILGHRVVWSASAIGFVVGFSMYGAMTFLPFFFQTVKGVSPTMSGLRLLPLMVGLFTTSMVAGQLLSKGWRYHRFPIFGTAIMTVGLALLGTVTMSTSSLMTTLVMLILGIGLGMVMQILVVAVQNAVELRDLGAATAAANFFRSMGGSFGTAAFGALYTNILPHKLENALAQHHLSGASVPPSSMWTPDRLFHLPGPVLHAILTSIAQSIQTVFRYTLPFGVLAFLLSLTLPDIKLRGQLGEAEAPSRPAE